jgi:hypothetical protein
MLRSIRSFVNLANVRQFGAQTKFDLKQNSMQIGVQTIFAGTESLAPFVANVKGYSKRPLIVTDGGLVPLNISVNNLMSVYVIIGQVGLVDSLG